MKSRFLRKGWLARPDGFEPPTPRFVVWCSIQLSYGRLLRIARENVPGPAKGRLERAFPYRLRSPLASLRGTGRPYPSRRVATQRPQDEGGTRQSTRTWLPCKTLTPASPR
jgi:hypothetical protein